MSIRFLLLALLAIAIVCNAHIISDKSKRIHAQHDKSVNDVTGRIIGGSEADQGQFPYIVSLRDDLGHFCGGSIISNRWIMTAQHCVVGIESILDEFRIVTGAHNSAIGGDEYLVDRVVRHPEYDSYLLQNDISILRTSSEIVFGDRVAVIPISNEHVGAGVMTRTSGWGSTVLWGESAEYLQYLDLISLINLDCETRVSDGYPVSDDMLCAYSMERGRGICHGDSGSPLTSNGVVIGISSWVVPCAQGRPDGFVRVSHFYDWIITSMANETYIA